MSSKGSGTQRAQHQWREWTDGVSGWDPSTDTICPAESLKYFWSSFQICAWCSCFTLCVTTGLGLNLALTVQTPDQAETHPLTNYNSFDLPLIQREAVKLCVQTSSCWKQEVLALGILGLEHHLPVCGAVLCSIDTELH